MTLFLQILGVVFLLVLIAVIYFLLKFRRYLKKINSTYGNSFLLAQTVLPQLDLQLEKSNRNKWLRPERLEQNERLLERLAAEHVGYYLLRLQASEIRVSLWVLQHKVNVVIYEGVALVNDQPHGEPQTSCDVLVHLEGGSFCVTNSRSIGVLPRHPDHVIIQTHSDSLKVLLEEFKAQFPKGRKVQVVVNALQQFKDTYTDNIVWVWREEQLRSPQIQQCLQTVGVEITEDLMNLLIDQGNSFRQNYYSEKALRKLSQNSKMDGRKWDQIKDRVVSIHSEMSTESIVNLMYELAGELTEEQENILDYFVEKNPELVDPFVAFITLTHALQIKAKRLAKFDMSPVEVEVYYV